MLVQAFISSQPSLAQAGRGVSCNLRAALSLKQEQNKCLDPPLPCRALPSSQAPREPGGQRERDSLLCIIHTSASLSIFNVQCVERFPPPAIFSNIAAS